ncbi:MAG TPA: hypothetical protein VGB12_09940 [bacterium]|jgi:hypothetical protein
MRVTNTIKAAMWIFTIVSGIFLLSVPRLAQWMERVNDQKVIAMGYTPSSVLLRQGGMSEAQVKASAKGRFEKGTDRNASK